MANGIHRSRSPIRAITSLNSGVSDSTVVRPPSWGETDAYDGSPALPRPSLSPVVDCPRCGSALQLDLRPVHGPNGGGAHHGGALRPAPEPEPIPDFEESVNAYKRQLLNRALDENGRVMTRAARDLGLKYTTFVAMAHRLGVVGDDEDGDDEAGGDDAAE